MACETILNELSDLVNQVGNSNCPPSRGSLLGELNDLIKQIDGCPPPPSCPPPPCPVTWPYAEVVITCPPPVLSPVYPQPVKPLQIRCPEQKTPYSDFPLEDRERMRYDNFYNNYNINWHAESPRFRNKNKLQPECTEVKQRGLTLDGKSPCCDESPQNDCFELPGCPNGFTPTKMKLCPPPFCHPYGVWCAEIQPCAPKARKEIWEPGDCYGKKCK